MRSASSATVDALTDAPAKGIVPRRFFWARVKDRDTGDPVELAYWSGDDTVTVNVISGETGLPVARTYVGGVNLEVGAIPRVSDLTVQTVPVTLSAIADVTQQLVRQYDARLAKAEIHAGLLDTASRDLVDAPEIAFLGEIDGAPIETGAADGGDSLIRLGVRSDAILMLTRTNPTKRSHEGQQRRQGDNFRRYANAVTTWQVAWGAEQQR